MPGPRSVAPAAGPVSMIDALTGIRAPALLIVLLVHLREPLLTLLPRAAAIDTWLRSGFLAVDTFFILSGFVISHNYAHGLAAGRRRPGALAQYLVARLARIYPAYLLAFVLMAVVVIGFALDPRSQFTAAGFVASLLLLQPLPGVEVWNGPTWSVGCEVAAYALFPFVAGGLLRLRRGVAVVLATALVAALVLAVEAMYAAAGPFPFVTYFWVRLLVGFPLGCLMWVIWHHGGRGTRPGRRWDVVAVLAVVAILFVIGTEGQGPTSYVVVGLLAVFVLAAASATGVVRRALSWRPVTWCGEISLSVYLVHYPLYLILFAVLPAAAFRDASTAVRVAVVATPFVVALAVGAALHHLAEEPARRAIRRAWNARAARRDPRPEPAVPT